MTIIYDISLSYLQNWTINNKHTFPSIQAGANYGWGAVIHASQPQSVLRLHLECCYEWISDDFSFTKWSNLWSVPHLLGWHAACVETVRNGYVVPHVSFGLGNPWSRRGSQDDSIGPLANLTQSLVVLLTKCSDRNSESLDALCFCTWTSKLCSVTNSVFVHHSFMVTQLLDTLSALSFFNEGLNRLRMEMMRPRTIRAIQRSHHPCRFQLSAFSVFCSTCRTILGLALTAKGAPAQQHRTTRTTR